MKDGNAGGGAGCPQVPLIKGNLNSPPCSYLRTGACLSSAAGWCNELHSRTLNALQDSPCRAIMSTPAHQFRLPEPPFHKYGVGMSCPPKTLRGASVYFISHLEVTRSLRTSVRCPGVRGVKDGLEPGFAWHQSTYVRAVGFEPRRRTKGCGEYWECGLGEARGCLKSSGGGWRKVNSGTGMKRSVRVSMKDKLDDRDRAVEGRRSKNLGVMRPMEEGG